MTNFDLYYAAAYGKYEEVKEILRVGNCDVDFRNEYTDGKTPLYIAASWGTDDHMIVIDLLLAHGADIDQPNDRLQTPLYVAASWGHINVVNLLIKNDADIDAKNHEGRTPLHIAACWKPHMSTYENKFAAYDKNSLKRMVETAVQSMKSSLMNYSEYLPNMDEDYLKLKEASLKSDVSDEAAELAILYNHFGVVAALVEAGADINAIDKRGETALYKASFARNGEISNYLKDNGGKKLDPNILNFFLPYLKIIVNNIYWCPARTVRKKNEND